MLTRLESKFRSKKKSVNFSRKHIGLMHSKFLLIIAFTKKLRISSFSPGDECILISSKLYSFLYLDQRP